MPSRDHTGPSGEGPMTGRQLGDCKNKEEQPINSRPRLGLGRGRGPGLGRRQGRFDGRRLYRNRHFND
jgi:hypothetical protein